MFTAEVDLPYINKACTLQISHLQGFLLGGALAILSL